MRSIGLMALTCGLIVALSLSWAPSAIWYYHEQSLQAQENRMRSLGMVLAEQTARYVQAIDLTLQLMQTHVGDLGATTPDEFAVRMTSAPVHDLLAGSIPKSSIINAVVLVASDGKLVNWSRAGALPSLNAADRDHYRYFREHDDPGLFVGAPSKSVINGSWCLFFARRINGRDGQFLGMIVAIVYDDFLRDLYHRVGGGTEQSMALLRRDGTILLRDPDPNHVAGKQLPAGSEWYDEVAAGGGGYRARNFYSQVPNLVSVHLVKDYPLVVDIVMTRYAALAAWRWQTSFIAGFALLAAGALITLSAQLARQFNRQTRQNEKLKSYADMSVDYFWEQDTDNRFTAQNDPASWSETLGMRRGSATGRTRRDLADPTMSQERWTAHEADLAAHRSFRDFLWERAHPDGSVVYVTSNGDPTFDGKGVFTGYRGTGRNITADVAAAGRLARTHAELEHSHLQMDALLDNIDIGVCFFDGTRRLQAWNRRYTEIYQLPADMIHAGMTLYDILQFRHLAGHHPALTQSEFLAWRDKLAAAGQPSRTTIRLANGRHIAIHYQPMKDGGWVATHEDITNRKQAEERIAFLAEHDALTGLANRELFRQRLDQALGMAGVDSGFALLWLDLDNFKAINDTFGHLTGDALLEGVAKRLETCVRAMDTVARLGDDEFAILQLDIDHSNQPALLANRILEVLRSPFVVDGHQITVRANIGISVAPTDGIVAETLLKHADIALYLAKTEGRGAVRFFEPEMDAQIQLRRALESDLCTALENDEFELYYQPLIDLATGRACCFEALLRWRHPTRGLIPPTEFIPIAEETGLIVPIGDWVLHNACKAAAEWPASVSVSVNLSAVQFKKSDVNASVQTALELSSLPAKRLELEITETILMEDIDRAITCLHRLRDTGVVIALDDFGTGYSSLSYLNQFPFDKLKIDQSFVQQMERNKEAMSILDAIVALGRSLAIRTTAEGVETSYQLEQLRQKGCTEVQGYLFSRPVREGEVAGLIERLGTAGGKLAAAD